MTLFSSSRSGTSPSLHSKYSYSSPTSWLRWISTTSSRISCSTHWWWLYRTIICTQRWSVRCTTRKSTRSICRCSWLHACLPFSWLSCGPCTPFSDFPVPHQTRTPRNSQLLCTLTFWMRQQILSLHLDSLATWPRLKRNGARRAACWATSTTTTSRKTGWARLHPEISTWLPKKKIKMKKIAVMKTTARNLSCHRRVAAQGKHYSKKVTWRLSSRLWHRDARKATHLASNPAS